MLPSVIRLLLKFNWKVSPAGLGAVQCLSLYPVCLFSTALRRLASMSITFKVVFGRHLFIVYSTMHEQVLWLCERNILRAAHRLFVISEGVQSRTALHFPWWRGDNRPTCLSGCEGKSFRDSVALRTKLLRQGECSVVNLYESGG